MSWPITMHGIMALQPIRTHLFWFTQPIKAQESGTPGQSVHKKMILLANQGAGIHNTQPISTQESPPSQLVHVNLVPLANHHRGIWCSWPISTQESHTLSQSVHGIPLLPSQSVHGDLVPLANQRVGIQYPRPISMHTPPAQAANGLLRALGAGPMGCRGRGLTSPCCGAPGRAAGAAPAYGGAGRGVRAGGPRGLRPGPPHRSPGAAAVLGDTERVREHKPAPNTPKPAPRAPPKPAQSEPRIIPES